MKKTFFLYLMTTVFSTNLFADGKLSCLPSQKYPGDFYIGKTSTDLVGGYYSKQIDCLLALKSIKNGKLCAASQKYPGDYYILKISSNERTGGYFKNLPKCLLSLKFQ